MMRCRLSESEVRETLADILDQRSRPYTWVTGKLDLVLSSGETLRGDLERIERRNAIVRTGAGVVEVALAEVENVLVWMSSPGPE